MTDNLVTIVKQAPGAPFQLYRRINALLKTPGLKRLRIAVAYARWAGLGLIAKHIESFLDGGGEFQSIYGVANGVTTPDSLLYNLYLKTLYKTHTYAGAIKDEYSNSIYHPKFFEFRFGKEAIAIIGSANLTGGGLSQNTELGVEFHYAHGTVLQKQVEAAWNSMRGEAREVTSKLIRKLQRQSELASERDRGENQSGRNKSRLALRAKASPKPLFSKVLDLPQPSRRIKIFSKLDTLSVQPRRLYLQILKGETGGQVGGKHPGYQIQLPVATLAAFFGLGENETKKASFQFPGELVAASLTHFPNKTHRVRLRPLRDIKRPALVTFQRMGTDTYKCSVVPLESYKKVLAAKCTEQQRKGARRWGLE